MTDSERREAFLTLFKELESALVKIAGLEKEEYVSFSKSLNQIYYHRLHPLLSVYENYDFLKTASDLRNILSHENNVCYPSESFYERFASLVEDILHPLTAYEIASKTIVSADWEESIQTLSRRMEEKGISQIPLLSPQGRVEAVFSRESFFDYVLSGKKEARTLSDMKEVLLLESHRNEEYRFVRREEKADGLVSYFVKSKAHAKNICVLFVTENGKRSEKVIGIITSTDLLKRRH